MAGDSKLNDETSLGINLKRLIQITVVAAMALWGYFGLTSKISQLEIDVLRMKDSVEMNSEFRVKCSDTNPANILSGADVDLEASAGNWTVYYSQGGNTGARNTSSPISGTADFKTNGDGVNTVTATYAGDNGLAGFTVGRRYRWEFDAKHSGSGVSGRPAVGTTHTNTDLGTVEVTASMTSAATVSIDFTATVSTVFFSFGYLSAGAMNDVQYDNLKIYMKPSCGWSRDIINDPEQLE